MTIARWTPPVTATRQERILLKRLGRVRKLFAFLRMHRHELFDDAFQEELAAMYRRTGAGKPALPPALLAMATLVQGYLGVSDAEMVELTVVDLRVQMVLGCLGAEAPPCSQGALQEFRERLIAADLDRRVLESSRDYSPPRHRGPTFIATSGPAFALNGSPDRAPTAHRRRLQQVLVLFVEIFYTHRR